MPSRIRIVFALALLAGSTIAIACGSDAGSGDTGGPGVDGSADDSATPPATGDGGGGDASKGDASPAGDAGVDANGPGEAGATCSFNRDCNAALRCECSESAGCACAPGARGTGRNGLDACDGGNDCASSVCVEGPAGTSFFCSDECVTSATCVGALPVCTDIAFVGRICVRDAG